MLHLMCVWSMMVSTAVAELCGTEYDVTHGCDISYGHGIEPRYNTRSVTECSQWCWSQPYCVSLKYDPVNQMCHLNAQRYHSLNTDCPVKLRYAQVTERSCHQLINQECTIPKQCFPVNSECVYTAHASGTCQCWPGHVYNDITGNCDMTRPCDSFGFHPEYDGSGWHELDGC